MDAIADFLTPLDDLSPRPQGSGWKRLLPRMAVGWSEKTFKRIFGAEVARPAVQADLLDNYEIKAQKDTEWCWAITTVSILNYYCGLTQPPSRCTVSVCDLVERQYGPCGANCENCKKKFGFLELRLEHYGCCTPLSERKSPADFDAAQNSMSVKGEITAKRPIGVRLSQGDGGGPHYVVIVGYVIGTDSTNYVLVHDPAVDETTPSKIPYERLVAGYPQQGAAWEETYFTQPIQNQYCGGALVS